MPVDVYKKKIKVMHRTLGIAADYEKERGLALQVECQRLVETELDVFNRQPLLDVAANQAWLKMKKAASVDGIHLQIISAYRSAEYQMQLWENKLARGNTLEEILKVNAAPGYSEHHTGQAIDIGCDGYEHLEEEFEKSQAYSWLSKNAEKYGFFLSFPRNNLGGFLYEPWHWKFSIKR